MTVDIPVITISHPPPAPALERWFRGVVDRHGDRPVTRRRTPDTLVVYFERDDALTLPAVAFPTLTANEYRLDLYGMGDVFTVRVGTRTGTEWAAYADDIHARNQRLGLTIDERQPGHTTRLPSALVPIVSAFQPLGRSSARRLRVVTERHTLIDIPVKGSGLRQQTERFVAVDLTTNGHPLEARLPLEHAASPRAITGPETELASLCLARLSRLDTETFKDMLALIDVAVTQQSRIIAINIRADHPDLPASAATATWADLGRRRGWRDLDVRDRRQRLRESIDLLMSVQFTFDLLNDPQGRRLSGIPLFYRAGFVEQDHHRLGVIVGFNDLLWRSMTEQQRSIVFDRACLATTPAQEWHLRFYYALMVRLNRSWITQRLGEHRGRLVMTLGALLDSTGLDYQSQLRGKGPAWLRDRVDRVFGQLRQPIWSGRPLLARADRESRPDVLDDRITIYPPAHLVAELNGHRSKSLASRSTRARSAAGPETEVSPTGGR